MRARIVLPLVLLISVFAIPSAAVAGDSSPGAVVKTYTGIASHYAGTSGWIGTPHLALAGGLGGRYTGHINAMVTVCATRCLYLPSVDYCQCYWGTPDQRLVDLSPEAWALITDKPLSAGLVSVRVELPVDIKTEPPPLLPNTSFAR